MNDIRNGLVFLVKSIKLLIGGRRIKPAEFLLIAADFEIVNKRQNLFDHGNILNEISSGIEAHFKPAASSKLHTTDECFGVIAFAHETNTGDGILILGDHHGEDAFKIKTAVFAKPRGMTAITMPLAIGDGEHERNLVRYFLKSDITGIILDHS
jgi:hypothetical protein